MRSINTENRLFRKVLALRWMIVYVGVFLALIWVIPVEAASFDCKQVNLDPMEHLICGDNVLSSLDSQLAKVYYAQRDALPENQVHSLALDERLWGEARYELCQVPTVGDGRDLSDTLRTRMLPCLKALYQQRLRTLQVQSATVDVLPADWIHPVCMALMVPMLVQGKTANISTSYCAAMAHRSRVVGSPEWGYLVNGLNAGWTDFSQKYSRNWVSVVPVSAHSPSMVMVHYLIGPALRSASALVQVSILKNSIQAVPVFQAGDRCAGGIEQAEMQPDGSLNVHLAIGDVGLLRIISGKGFKDTNGAPWDCYAHLSLQVNAQQNPVMQSVTLNSLPTELKAADCMTVALQKVSPTTAPMTYDASVFKVLNREYNTCRDQGVAAGIAD